MEEVNIQKVLPDRPTENQALIPVVKKSKKESKEDAIMSDLMLEVEHEDSNVVITHTQETKEKTLKIISFQDSLLGFKGTEFNGVAHGASAMDEKSLPVVWRNLFDLSLLGSFVPSPDSEASAIVTRLILLLVFSMGDYILKITTILCYIISQAGLGMVIEELGMLQTTIKQLEDTMKSLDQVRKEIESTGEATESLTSWLEEGKKLVSETSKMGWWNFVKNWQYQMKMVELENKLLRFHRLYLQARLVENNDKTSEDDSKIKALRR